jgi:AcrR family transcriptional regulator
MVPLEDRRIQSERLRRDAANPKLHALMGRPLFDNRGFLAVARALACERGPAAVTIDSVTQRLKAAKGSFYYRFASRDALLGELWLATLLAYQEGFVAAIKPATALPPRFIRLPGHACIWMMHACSCFTTATISGRLACTTQTRRARSSAALRGMPEEVCTTCLRSGRSHANPVRHLCASRSSDRCREDPPPTSRAWGTEGG